MSSQKNPALIPLLLLAALALPASSDAQSLTTSYQIRIYLVGGGDAPVTTFDVNVNDTRCGLPKTPAPAGTVINPSRLRWDDPINPTAMDCEWIDSGTGPLFALPISVTATYVVGMTATDPTGTSPESARSNPFTRRGLPAAPAGVRLIRP